jgi:hypothetical protein
MEAKNMSEFLSKEGLEFIAENYLILDKDVIFKSETLDYRQDYVTIWDPNIYSSILIYSYVVADEGSLFLEDH